MFSIFFFFFWRGREEKERGDREERDGEKEVRGREAGNESPMGRKKKKKLSLSLFLSLSSSSLLLTVVIQSKVAAEFAGAFLSAPEVSSSGASCEFLAPLPVEMLPPGAAETSRPTNERAGELRSCEPAAAVLGIAAEVRERVPSLRTRSRALGLAATWREKERGEADEVRLRREEVANLRKRG